VVRDYLGSIVAAFPDSISEEGNDFLSMPCVPSILSSYTAITDGGFGCTIAPKKHIPVVQSQSP